MTNQYRFIPAIPMTEEEADLYLEDLKDEGFHFLESTRMRREDELARENIKLMTDILKAFKSGTKQ